MPLTPEEIAAQQAQQDKLAFDATVADNLKKYNAGLTDGANTLDKQVTFADRLSNLLHGISTNAGQANDAFAILGKSLAISDLIDLVEKAKETIGELGKESAFALLPLLDILPATRDLFGELGASGMKAGNSIHDAFSKITEIPIISKEFGKLAPALDRVFTSADKSQNMQMGLIAMAAASGNLNSVMESTGNKFQNLTNFAADYNERILNTANASGMLATTVASYAAKLGVIPGALEPTIVTTDKYTKGLTELEASIKIASAFQMSHTDVVDQLNFAYRNFNTTGEKALQFVASMAQQAQDLHMPMDIVSRTTKSASEQFKLLGDNSQAAMNILANVGDALKGSNIGPEGIAQITGDMISGIKSLDVATKAFISGQSGGRGGLAGAFQIDSLLQQGKLDEVMQMTQRAMKKQIGGPVVTLEDANKNPNQSGQLLKEIELLKNVMHLAKSDDEAFRILDVMKKGGPGGDAFKAPKTGPEEALQKAVGQGTSIQEKGFNKLTEISNEILKTETIVAASNNELVKHLFGTEGKSPFASGLKTEMEKSTGLASSPKKTTLDDQQKGFTDGIGKAIDTIRNMVSTMPDFTGLVKPFSKEKEQGEKIPNNALPPGGPKAMQPMFMQNTAGPKNDIMENPPFLIPALGLGPKSPTTGPASAQTVLAPAEMTQAQKNQQAGSSSGSATRGGTSQNEQNKQHVMSDGTIRVEVDIKDGVTTIARAVAKQEIQGRSGSFNGIQNRNP